MNDSRTISRNLSRHELPFCLELVEACGALALGYLDRGSHGLGLRYKPRGGGPVTEADRALNDRITSALARRFPGDGILAEESAHDGPWRDAERCWYVDPIDGTREFARGRSGWTVQLGLCIEGRPVLGVVAEPALRRISWAVLEPEIEAGQRLGRGPVEPLRTSERPLGELRLVGGRMYPLSRQHAVRRLLGVPPDRRSAVGSVGVRMTRVARGEADAYVQAPGRTKLWDTCGPLALVIAAGGKVTDLRGAPLQYRGKLSHPRGMLCSGAAQHGPLLERLAPLVDSWVRGDGASASGSWPER